MKKQVIYNAGSETVLPVFLLETSESLDYKKIFEEKCEEFIIQLSHEVAQSIPANITLKKDLPDSIRRYIEIENSRPNGISGVFERESLKNKQYFICWDDFAYIYKFTNDGGFKFYKQLDPDFLEKCKNVDYRIDSIFCPVNEFEFIHFLDQADEIYGTFRANSLNDLPSVEFTMKSRTEMSCKVNGKRIYNIFFESGRSVSVCIKELFRLILQDTVDLRNHNREYLKILNQAKLSFLELEILKHIVKKRETWLCETERYMNASIQAIPSSVDRCCEKLCQLQYKDSAVSRPFLSIKNKKNDNYASSVFYVLNNDLSEDVISYVKIRPCVPADFADFSKNGQLRLCCRMCAQSFTPDEKWASLQMIETLPQSLIKNFVESHEGSDFFLSLTKNDRIYAAYFLSSIEDERCIELSNILLKV